MDEAGAKTVATTVGALFHSVHDDLREQVRGLDHGTINWKPLPLANSIAVLVVHTLGPASEGKLVYFMSVDSARFRRPVVPGDCLHVRVTKQRNRGNVWKFEGRAVIDGRLAAEAVFAAMILD